MTTQAIVPVAGGGRAQLPQLAEAVRVYADAGIAAGTRRSYGSSWRQFTSWCASVGVEPLPAEARDIALYLTARAPNLAVATLARHIAAIAAAHRAAGFAPPNHPDLAAVMAGIRRTHGRPARKKRALVVEDLRKVVAKLPATRIGIRDRALLLVGFAGALRRSELVALALPNRASDDADSGRQVVTAEFSAGGLEIHIARSKGDQEGRGAVVAIPYGKRMCPVAALQAWLAEAKITTGPVFRAVDRHGRISHRAISDRAAADVVKRACQRAGYDPAAFSGHSLRRGLITSAARKGAAPDLLRSHARHAKVETTMGYVEEAERFTRNAAGVVGL